VPAGPRRQTMSLMSPVDVHAVADAFRRRSRLAGDEFSARAARVRTIRIPTVWLGPIVAMLALAATQAIEMRTAVFQSHFFAAISRKLDWTMGPGPSPRIVF